MPSFWAGVIRMKRVPAKVSDDDDMAWRASHRKRLAVFLRCVKARQQRK